MKKLTLICLLAMVSSQVSGQSQDLHFDAHQYIDEQGDTLNYRMSVPDASGSQRYPVVVFLHGAGERGSDNLSQLKWGVKNFATDEAMMRYKPIVIAPQCPRDSTWSHFEGNFRGDDPIRLADRPSKPMKMTMEVLDQVTENLPVDTTRIYITGLSMGGFGTWDAIARWPDRFAAAVPVCGGGDPTTADRIAGIPIWALHGADDPVVPPALSRQMIEAVRDAGGSPGYTEYPAVGHYSWIQAYQDDYLLSWLFSQRKQ